MAIQHREHEQRRDTRYAGAATDQEEVNRLRYLRQQAGLRSNEYPKWLAARANFWDVRRSGYISRIGPEADRRFYINNARHPLQEGPYAEPDREQLDTLRLQVAEELAAEMTKEYAGWLDLNPRPMNTPSAPPDPVLRGTSGITTGTGRPVVTGDPPVIVITLPRSAEDPAVALIKARHAELMDTQPTTVDPLGPVGPLRLEDFDPTTVENFARDLTYRILTSRTLGWDTERIDQAIKGHVERVVANDFASLDPADIERLVAHASRAADGDEPSEEPDDDDLELPDPIIEFGNKAKQAVRAALRKWPQLDKAALVAAGPDPDAIRLRAEELAGEAS